MMRTSSEHELLPQSPTSPTSPYGRHTPRGSLWPDEEGDEPDARRHKFARRRRGGAAAWCAGLAWTDRLRLLCGALVLGVFVYAVSLDHGTDARERIRDSLHSAAHRLHDLTLTDGKAGMNKSLVLNFPDAPQDTFMSQLKPGVRYITTMSYGGHANQFMAIENLLYLSKLLSRVAIVPTLSPLHFNETPRDFSTFYDLDRFYLETEIPAVEMSAFKPWNFSRPAIKEQISCWSVLEQTAGNRNINDGSLAAHEIAVKYWALPPMERGSEGFNLWFESLHSFDFGRLKRDKWIERIKKELIPQQYPQVHPTASGDLSHERAKTLKPGFDPLGTPPPDENLFCLDTTFFLGSRILPPAYPLPDKRYEPPRLYEGHGWIQAGQFLRFSSPLEELATIYLQDLFGSATIPPFIAVHLRRGDFQSARGLTSLKAFTDAVQRVRDRLDWRMQHPDGWVGAGHAQQKYFAGVRGRHYAVVATTDEPPTSDFVRQLKDDLGWKVVDHERMHTEEDLGAWYPTMIDAAILARGRGFVGTEWSTFSYLAGLRVKYWNGGVEEWTPSLV